MNTRAKNNLTHISKREKKSISNQIKQNKLENQK